MALFNFTHYQMCAGNIILATGLSPYQCLLNSDIKFQIQKGKDSKKVFINNPLFVDKHIKVGPSYSNEWTDEDMLKDLAIKIINRWGYSISKVGW